MSRNKENAPLNPQRRVSVSGISLANTQQSDEFFTDSILESDVTRTSKIPTPVTQKTVRTKSRRSKRSTKPVPSGADLMVKERGLQSAIKIQRSKSPSPVRNRIAATPPQTRIRTDLVGPSIEIQSPPPEEFTDVYRQIADEEDLAATERDSSGSDDSLPEHSRNVRGDTIDYFRQPRPMNHSRFNKSHSSRSSTPTNHQRRRRNSADNGMEDHKEGLTDHTGMSFLNDLTDQALAAKLTPHMSESAKDRAKLREVWSNQKPVAFTKVGKSKAIVNGNRFHSASHTPEISTFSKAAHKGLYESDLDRVGRPESRHSDGSLENHALRFETWESSARNLKELPTNSRLERNFNFSRRHGFPQSRRVLSEQNLEQQNRGTIHRSYIQSGFGSPTSHHSDPVIGSIHSPGLHSDKSNEYSIRAQQIRNDIADLIKAEVLPLKREQKRHKDDSVIDWATAAADGSIPSKQVGSPSSSKDYAPESARKETSPEKSRRLDIDFTGQSFQVSESPPVRNRPINNDRSLGKEIESLTKRAVTTSRLGEIRERNSQEQLRHRSRSPAPSNRSLLLEQRQDATHNIQSERRESIGEPVPNTPVVIFRSNSTSSNGKKSSTHDESSKSNSDEYLQRFARAVSNTPKSSPASTVGHATVHPTNAGIHDAMQPTESTSNLQQKALSNKQTLAVAETPKVIGAWTDTILPDTIKTIKQGGAQAKYTQTPHVNAGGWVDTPIPVGLKGNKEMTPIAEEIPEELVSGIARGRVPQDRESAVNAGVLPVSANSLAVVPKVGLAGILDRAKQRLASQDITTAVRENDTLNLGNETIESLQDLLTLDADEFTVLSKVFNDEDEVAIADDAQAEAVILERIGTKLDRLRSNIHEARKGISQLEHKVSQSDATHSHDQGSMVDVCTTCKRSFHTDLPYSSGGSLPVAPLHITLPIPLLFHIEPKSSKTVKRTFLGFRVLQPTPLGWLTLAIWSWYIIECTLSEIYSHPTHAEYYTWPSPYYSEPEFPFVLPTMLSRWLQLNNLVSTAGLLFGWLATLLQATLKIIGMWAGWTDGFIDSAAGNRVIKSLTSTAAAAVGAETDMSMINDEFI